MLARGQGQAKRPEIVMRGAAGKRIPPEGPQGHVGHHNPSHFAIRTALRVPSLKDVLYWGRRESERERGGRGREGGEHPC